MPRLVRHLTMLFPFGLQCSMCLISFSIPVIPALNQRARGTPPVLQVRRAMPRYLVSMPVTRIVLVPMSRVPQTLPSGGSLEAIAPLQYPLRSTTEPLCWTASSSTNRSKAASGIHWEFTILRVRSRCALSQQAMGLYALLMPCDSRNPLHQRSAILHPQTVPSRWR